jgi:Flp pilus assembly protein TadD
MSCMNVWHGNQYSSGAQQQHQQHCSRHVSMRLARKGSSTRYGLCAATTASLAPAEQQTQQQLADNGGTRAVTGRRRPHAAQVDIKRKAKAARLSGNPQLALQLLLDGLECYPQDMHLVCAAASTAAKLGDADLAFELLSPALQQQPHNVHLLTAAAAAYTAAGNHAAARQCYQRAAAAHPTNAVVLTAWGVLEAAGDNPAAAVGLFKQAVAAAPSNTAAYVAWARLEAARGRPWEARSLHQQAHKHCPGHVPNLHVSNARLVCMLSHCLCIIWWL